MRPGAGTRDERDNKPLAILDAEFPPILVHPSHLGGALSAGQVFNIGVRLRTQQVSFVRLIISFDLNSFHFFSLLGTFFGHRWHWNLWGSARCLHINRRRLIEWSLVVYVCTPSDCRPWRFSNVPHSTPSTTAEFVQQICQFALRHKNWCNKNRRCFRRRWPSRSSTAFRRWWAARDCVRLIRTETIENWLRLRKASIAGCFLISKNEEEKKYLQEKSSLLDKDYWLSWTQFDILWNNFLELFIIWMAAQVGCSKTVKSEIWIFIAFETFWIRLAKGDEKKFWHPKDWH